MCGRFTLTQPPDTIARHFALGAAAPRAAKPRYNIAPTQTVCAVRVNAATGARELIEPRWGLIPSWSRAPAGSGLVNARAETLATKPAFRESFRSRRCLIPADGFYEWQAAGGRKQPWYIAMEDDSLFAFAGLWDAWRAPGGNTVLSCVIVTTAPNERLRAVHDRMPVIVPPADYDTWLGASVAETLAPLLRPYPSAALRMHPVSSLVSRPENDLPACREPLPDAATQKPPLLFNA